MALASPALRKRLKIISSRKTIVFPKTRSFYRALSADAYTKEGYNIHGLIFDELHAQRSRDLWDTLRYGGEARRQPLLISITTAGYDRNTVCWEQHEYAKKILEGIIDDESFFAYIRAANEEDDWTDPEVWAKANHSLGETISVDGFRQSCIEAQESPRKQAAFKRYRLNMWTSAAEDWIEPDKWKACAGDVDLTKLAGLRCWAGVDLSSTTDLSACAVIFEPDEEGLVHLLLWSWVLAENIAKRAKNDRVPYDLWAQQGWIEATEGNVIDHDWIRKKIRDDLKARFPLLQVVGYDPWNATKWAIDLESDGIPVIEVRQGFKTMSPATKAFERLVLSGKLLHDGNPLLEWCVSNVVLAEDPTGT